MKKRFKKILSLAISVFIVSQTVFVIPLSAESNQEKSYIYHFNDYETLLDEDGWLQKTTSDVVLTAETASPLSGEKSLKASSDGTTSSGYVGFALSDFQIPVGKSVRVCFDYKVVYGKAQYAASVSSATRKICITLLISLITHTPWPKQLFLKVPSWMKAKPSHAH